MTALYPQSDSSGSNIPFSSYPTTRIQSPRGPLPSSGIAESSTGSTATQDQTVLSASVVTVTVTEWGSEVSPLPSISSLLDGILSLQTSATAPPQASYGSSSFPESLSSKASASPFPLTSWQTATMSSNSTLNETLTVSIQPQRQALSGIIVVTATTTLTLTPERTPSESSNNIPTSTITPPFYTSSLPLYPLPSNSSTETTLISSKIVWTASGNVGNHRSSLALTSSRFTSNATQITETSTVFDNVTSTASPSQITFSNTGYSTINNSAVSGTGTPWGLPSNGTTLSIQNTTISQQISTSYVLPYTTSTVTPSMIVSTKLITITVYPTPFNATSVASQNSSNTVLSPITTTAVITGTYPGSNTGTFQIDSGHSTGNGTAPFTTARVDPWGRTMSSTLESGISSFHGSVSETPCLPGSYTKTTNVTLPSSTDGTVNRLTSK